MRYVYLLYGPDGFEAPYSTLAKAQGDLAGWTQDDPVTWAARDRDGMRWTVQKWAVQ